MFPSDAIDRRSTLTQALGTHRRRNSEGSEQGLYIELAFAFWDGEKLGNTLARLLLVNGI